MDVPVRLRATAAASSREFISGWPWGGGLETFWRLPMSGKQAVIFPVVILENNFFCPPLPGCAACCKALPEGEREAHKSL